MSDDLIERLRSYRSFDEFGDVQHAVCDEAADELSRLRAEVDRLKWERDVWREKMDYALKCERDARAALSDERAHADALMDDVRQRLSYDAETFHDQGAWDREDACLAIMKRIDLHRARRQG